MIVQQRINTNSAFVEEKECQQTVLKRNSDRKIELASHFNPSFLSTLPIAKGKKKTLLFTYEYTYLYTYEYKYTYNYKYKYF
jgi:hypothetical protein